VDDERNWQNMQLPPEIKELALTARNIGRFEKIGVFAPNFIFLQI
jgi:hypothetical protein